MKNSLVMSEVSTSVTFIASIMYDIMRLSLDTVGDYLSSLDSQLRWIFISSRPLLLTVTSSFLGFGHSSFQLSLHLSELSNTLLQFMVFFNIKKRNFLSLPGIYILLTMDLRYQFNSIHFHQVFSF